MLGVTVSLSVCQTLPLFPAAEGHQVDQLESTGLPTVEGRRRVRVVESGTTMADQKVMRGGASLRQKRQRER